MTDLDNEDLTDRLREELKERDEEIEVLRRKLEVARHNRAGVEPLVDPAIAALTP